MITIYVLKILFFLGVFYLIGYLSVEKEMEDNWKDEKTMEIRKSQNLAKEWTEKHPILTRFQDFYYAVNRISEKPGDFYRECKWFIQRGKRGYSERDVWGFYDYLNKVILGGLKKLKDTKTGCPCMVDEGDIPTGKDGNWTKAGETKAQKKWEKILDKMIWTFEALEKVENHEWEIVRNEKDRKELKNFVKRYNSPDKEPLFEGLELKKIHLMTKSEMRKYNEGWDLFKKYFQCLWD